MAHLTHDLEQSTESQKRRLTPAELCSLWRSAPYKLAFNELTQEVELDQASLPVVEIEEAYIGLSEKGYNADPRTTFDSVLKVAREGSLSPRAEVLRAPRTGRISSTCRPIDLLGGLLRNFRTVV